MKEIEQKITEWEANKKSWEETASSESVLQATWMIKGLKLALSIIKKSCNKVNASGACKKDPRMCLHGDDNCFGNSGCPEFERR